MQCHDSTITYKHYCNILASYKRSCYVCFQKSNSVLLLVFVDDSPLVFFLVEVITLELENTHVCTYGYNLTCINKLMFYINIGIYINAGALGFGIVVINLLMCSMADVYIL